MLPLFCSLARASGELPPIPKSKTVALDLFQKRIEKENREKAALQEKIKQINDSLSKTRTELVDVASSVRKNEIDLRKIEQKIANLEVRKAALQDQFNSDRASISKLIIALERIRRTPPEVMIARPDSPYKIAQSAMIMGSIIPSIDRHAAKLSKNLETLDYVTRELALEKNDLLAVLEKLEAQRKEMLLLLSKRKELYNKVNNDIKAREFFIQKISLQAKDLEELVKKIKENELAERKRLKKTAYLLRSKPEQKIVDDGWAQLPISGVVRTNYRQKDNLDANSKGITIEGRSGGLVVAPMSGKVQFTGEFKRYGNIIVIEHANGFHSLIAGLEEITTFVGAFIKSGEPIGILPNSSLIPRPTLYYELRKNGNPVNPAIKFPDLG